MKVKSSTLSGLSASKIRVTSTVQPTNGMPLLVLISDGKNGRGVKTYGVKYNNFHTMRNTFNLLIIFVFSFHCVVAELEFYPDFRKPDSSDLKWENERSAEEYALEQFTNYLQEQQRRLEIERQLQHEPDFTYSIPRINMEDAEFAVAPPDPRYYQQTPTEDEEFLNNDLEPEDEEELHDPQADLQNPNPQLQLQFQYQQYQQQLRKQQKQKLQQLIQHHKTIQQVLQSRKEREKEENSQDDDIQLKEDDTEVPKLSHPNTPKPNKPVVLKTRTELNWGSAGATKLHGSNSNEWRKQDLNNIVTGYHSDQAVDIKPVSSSLQDDSAGVYIIAVVAGISAAATVGLIAFVIGWYNLQKNVKNATDVEYPAYGVTGPNKDVSPTGDRRLAQSAQMYHYQHQKQQIIAMESRAAATVRHGSMSEAESDEENEEGDYTVYECPGLAPAGEMEVKNPLFQDDPTPASQPTSTKNEEPSLPDQK